jgi:hypothetical protein
LMRLLRFSPSMATSPELPTASPNIR